MRMRHRECKNKTGKNASDLEKNQKSTYNVKPENIKKMIKYLKSQNKK
jgi:hypothetical protein